MTEILSPRDGFILGYTTASGSPSASAMDCRGMMNFAYLEVGAYSPSAIVALQASRNGNSWITVLTVTALPASAQIQISAFYPWVRGVLNVSYASTGSAYMYYVPGNR